MAHNGTQRDTFRGKFGRIPPVHGFAEATRTSSIRNPSNKAACGPGSTNSRSSTPSACMRPEALSHRGRTTSRPAGRLLLISIETMDPATGWNPDRSRGWKLMGMKKGRRGSRPSIKVPRLVRRCSKSEAGSGGGLAKQAGPTGQLLLNCALSPGCT